MKNTAQHEVCRTATIDRSTGPIAGAHNAIMRRIARWQVTMAADRGDVPGWVLITVMTAGLITAIWVVADEQLTAILTKAINSVTK